MKMPPRKRKSRSPERVKRKKPKIDPVERAQMKLDKERKEYTDELTPDQIKFFKEWSNGAFDDYPEKEFMETIGRHVLPGPGGITMLPYQFFELKNKSWKEVMRQRRRKSRTMRSRSKRRSLARKVRQFNSRTRRLR